MLIMVPEDLPQGKFREQIHPKLHHRCKERCRNRVCQNPLVGSKSHSEQDQNQNQKIGNRKVNLANMMWKASAQENQERASKAIKVEKAIKVWKVLKVQNQFSNLEITDQYLAFLKNLIKAIRKKIRNR